MLLKMKNECGVSKQTEAENDVREDNSNEEKKPLIRQNSSVDGTSLIVAPELVGGAAHD